LSQPWSHLIEATAFLS